MSRILFLSRWFPDPPNNGSKLRIYNLLRGLAARHDVTLLSFHDPDADPCTVAGASSDLRQFCAQIETIPWERYEPDALRARLGFLSPRPRFVVDTYSPAMHDAIVRLLSCQAYDAVIASQIDMAVYRSAFGDTPALFEEVEVATLYEQYQDAASPHARLRYGLTWLKHRRYLRRLLHDFRAATVVSPQEKRLLALAAPHFQSVAVIPNCVDIGWYDGIQARPQKNRLIFTGALTYDANYEAVVWFLRRVYPLIQQEIPDVQLTITGDHGGRPLPPGDGVTLTGFVDDVRPLIAGAAVSLAPILSGGGTRLKILEAMALCTPVVSTSKGAEGLAARDGEHLLMADDPEKFARAVVQLLTEPQLARRLAGAAHCLVQKQYDWTAAMPPFLDLVQSVISAKRQPAGKELWPN